MASVRPIVPVLQPVLPIVPVAVEVDILDRIMFIGDLCIILPVPVVEVIDAIVPVIATAADYPLTGQLGFQDPASDWMYAIIDLHDRIIFYLIIILAVVVWILISALINNDHLAYLHHGNMIELIWTLTPAGILWAIGLPSLRLLYIMDEILDAEITIKAIGNQWYWSYEYSDYVDNNGSEIAFDSFMVQYDDLNPGDIRNLHVDNYLVLPVGVSTRLLVSSNDVIHCFAIPSLAIKSDAIPGRLNATGFIINRSSDFYGQCSELCGVLHGFMPIGIHATSIPVYLGWVNSQLDIPTLVVCDGRGHNTIMTARCRATNSYIYPLRGNYLNREINIPTNYPTIIPILRAFLRMARCSSSNVLVLGKDVTKILI